MVYLQAKYVNEMFNHAFQDDPNECCGILAGESGEVKKLYRMTNPEASPYRYRMDSKELLNVYNEIDDQGWEILAIYHSHTHSEAYPSATDIRLATWADSLYLLISLLDKQKPILRAIHIQNGEVSEESIETD